MKIQNICALMFMATCTAAGANENNTHEETSILEREQLLGDMAGLRSSASEQGINIGVEYTSTYQSNRSVKDNSDSGYFGRLDIKTSFDLGKMGLWENGSIHAQLQAHNGGDNSLGYTGTPFTNPNTASFMGDDLFMSSLYYMHRFEQSTMLIGKIDALELMKDAPFYGGAGRTGFMNLAFAAPPSGIIPPAFLGTIINWQSDNIDWSFMLFDPTNRYSDNSFSDPFENGIAGTLTASHTRKVFGRTSNVSVSGTYTNMESRDLEHPVGEDALIPSKHNLSIQASHNLYENPNNPAQSWGVYARAAIADGNPNLIESTATFGIGGKAPFKMRQNDQWGVGYFKNNLSDPLQDTLGNIPTDKAELLDENGMEIYYSYALTPAVDITADIQYIESADDSHNVVAGFRANIRL